MTSYSQVQCHTSQSMGRSMSRSMSRRGANNDNNKVAGGFMDPQLATRTDRNIPEMGEMSSNSNPRGRLGIHAVAWELWFPWNRGAPHRTCASYENDTHTRKTLNTSALGTRGHARNLRNPKASCLVSCCSYAGLAWQLVFDWFSMAWGSMKMNNMRWMPFLV